MSDAFSIQEADGRYEVSGTLDFTTARQALERIAPLVQSHQHLDLGFGKVTRSNSAALSLLIELKGLARRAGHQVSFSNIPEGLHQLAVVCEVDTYLR